MARDLSFWKKKNNIQIKNSDIYRDLSNGKYLDYICEIPSEEILQDIVCGFSRWRRLNNYCFAKGNASFELFITKQFVRADCYNMTEKDMNKMIDILLKYDCPLYDAAIDIRFDGSQ